MTCIHTISNHESPLRCVSWSSGSLLIASASEDKRLDIHAVSSVYGVTHLHSIVSNSAINSIAFQPSRIHRGGSTATDNTVTIAYADDSTLGNFIGNVYIFSIVFNAT